MNSGEQHTRYDIEVTILAAVYTVKRNGAAATRVDSLHPILQERNSTVHLQKTKQIRNIQLRKTLRCTQE